MSGYFKFELFFYIILIVFKFEQSKNYRDYSSAMRKDWSLGELWTVYYFSNK